MPKNNQKAHEIFFANKTEGEITLGVILLKKIQISSPDYAIIIKNSTNLDKN